VPTLSADPLVHRLIAEDEEVRAALRERLGTTDRGEIAAIVFADRAALGWLEELLHPRVREEVAAWVAAQDADVVAVEIPLLYETGGEDAYDAVLVVTAPPEVRDARSAVRRDSRSDRLIPDDEKVRRADDSYVNTGSLEELDAFVGGLLDRLRTR
jgi:dephospho-CoA kinase